MTLDREAWRQRQTRKLWNKEVLRGTNAMRRLLALPVLSLADAEDQDLLFRTCIEDIVQPSETSLQPALVYCSEKIPVLACLGSLRRLKPFLAKLVECHEIYPSMRKVHGVLFEQADQYFVFLDSVPNLTDTSRVLFGDQGTHEVRTLRHYLEGLRLLKPAEEE